MCVLVICAWYREMADVAKSGAIVPESVLKKQKRAEEWALAKTKDVAEAKKKKVETRKLICQKARDYAKEYEEQVQFYIHASNVSDIQVPS